MFRRSRGRIMRRPMRAPIVTYKHQRQENSTYIGAGANEAYSVYLGVPPGSVATPVDVPAGNKVYSFDVSVNYIQESSSGNATINWMLLHLRADQNVASLFADPNAADWSTIGLSLARNQVIKSFIGKVGSEDAGPKVWNMHVKIPKLWHRVREGDKIFLIFNSNNAGALTIGTRFKSYS